MTGFNNITSVADLVSATGTATGGVSTMLIPIVLFVVVLVVLLRQNPPQESFVSSSAVGALVSLALYAGGVLDVVVVVGFSVLLAVSAVALKLQS